jgi:hypothetical protein
VAELSDGGEDLAHEVVTLNLEKTTSRLGGKEVNEDLYLEVLEGGADEGADGFAVFELAAHHDTVAPRQAPWGEEAVLRIHGYGCPWRRSSLTSLKSLWMQKKE